MAEQTRATGHSTLGLVRGLQRILPSPADEHVYYGATVQDLTDTWFGLVMRDVGDVVRRDLVAVAAVLIDLAETHRTTLVAGRTHGQPGAPVTFGFKAASWADEVGRHLDRLAEGRPRWATGQLGGAVGVLGFFGEDAARLRAELCAEVGLADPGISWLTARDRLAEFGHTLAMVAATLARIGLEVYELARDEIGELREPAPAGAVSSITMPHKRNPESAEHLDTLARLVRSSSAILLESMVGAHERDGRTLEGRVGGPARGVPAHRRRAGDRAAAAGRPRGRRRRDAGQPRAARRPDRLRAAAGRARAAAGQAPGPGRCCTSCCASATSAPPTWCPRWCREQVATAEEIRGWIADPGITGAVQMVDAVIARTHRLAGGAPPEAS